MLNEPRDVLRICSECARDSGFTRFVLAAFAILYECATAAAQFSAFLILQSSLAKPKRNRGNSATWRPDAREKKALRGIHEQ